MKQLLLLALTSMMFLATTLLFVSCENKRYQMTESEILSETGTVIAKQYQGEKTTSTQGVGITMSGDVVFGEASSHSPQQFDVVFSCEHGTIFTINDKIVYASVKEDSEVTIFYKERYRDGKLYDYKFISVIPQQQ